MHNHLDIFRKIIHTYSSGVVTPQNGHFFHFSFSMREIVELQEYSQ